MTPRCVECAPAPLGWVAPSWLRRHPDAAEVVLRCGACTHHHFGMCGATWDAVPVPDVGFCLRTVLTAGGIRFFWQHSTTRKWRRVPASQSFLDAREMLHLACRQLGVDALLYR